MQQFIRSKHSLINSWNFACSFQALCIPMKRPFLLHRFWMMQPLTVVILQCLNVLTMCWLVVFTCGGFIRYQVLVQVSRGCSLLSRPPVLLCITTLVILDLASSAASTTTWRCILPCPTQLGASQHRWHSTRASCICSFFLTVKDLLLSTACDLHDTLVNCMLSCLSTDVLHLTAVNDQLHVESICTIT